MRLPDCPSCGENDWIGPTNQICANCLRGLSPEGKRRIMEGLNSDFRELAEEWEELGHELRKHAKSMEDSARGSTWEQAATELEGVLEE